MPRLKEYRGNPELKRYAAFERFDGGLNTTSVDEAVYENEFRELVNVELIEQGMVQNRKGFGEFALLNELFEEDDYFDEDAKFALMKVVKDTHNLLYRMKQYSTLTDFNASMVDVEYELDILFIRNAPSGLASATDITLYELAPSGGELTATSTTLATLSVVPFTYSNIVGVPTVDFEDNVYINKNMIWSLLSGFYVYNTTDKTLSSFNEDSGYYVPSPYEVSNVGFNVLADQPFEVSGDTEGVAEVRNIFLTNYSSDTSLNGKVMLRKIPPNEWFYLNVLYRGDLTLGDLKISLYEEDAFGEKQELAFTKETDTSGTYGLNLHRFLIKGNFTNKSMVFIKVFQEEDQEVTFSRAFATSAAMITSFTSRQKVLVKQTSLYATGYVPSTETYGHVVATVPGLSPDLASKTAIDLPVYSLDTAYPLYKNTTSQIIVGTTVYAANFDSDGKVIIPEGVSAFTDLDTPTGTQVNVFDAFVASVNNERPNLFEIYKTGDVVTRSYEETDVTGYTEATTKYTLAGTYSDVSTLESAMESAYDVNSVPEDTAIRGALYDDEASAFDFSTLSEDFIRSLDTGALVAETNAWSTEVIDAPSVIDYKYKFYFTEGNGLGTNESYNFRALFYNSAGSYLGGLASTYNYTELTSITFDISGESWKDNVAKVAFSLWILDATPSVVEADLTEVSVGGTSYVYYELTLTGTPVVYYELKDLSSYIGTLSNDFEVVEPETVDIVSFTNFYEIGTEENQDPVEAISTKGVGMLAYQNRLMLYGGNTIVFSDPFKFNYFPNYNYIVLPLDSDDSIQKIAYYRGSHIIFTKERIYRMSGTFGSEDFKVTLVNDTLGCIAPNSVRGINNTLVFLARDGLYTLKQSYYMEGLENVEKIDKQIKGIIPYGTNYESILYNEQYILLLKDISGTYTKTVKQYYNMEFAKYRFPYVTDVYSVVPDNLFKIGTDIFSIKDGVFYLYDSGYTDFGTTYEYVVMTPNFMLGYPEHDKKFKNIYIKTKSNAKHPIYITIYIDDNEFITPYTYKMTMSADGFLYEPVLTRSTTTGGTAFIVDGTADYEVSSDADGTTYTDTETGSTLTEADEEFTYGVDYLGGHETVIHKIVVSGKGKSIRMKIQQMSDKLFGLQSIGLLHKLGKAKETR